MVDSDEPLEPGSLAAARATAFELAQTTRSTDSRFVLAESCTAGLASALMAEIPGISNYLCGSAVTYREATKSRWLDVLKDTLDQWTAVSKPTTFEMAVGVLKKTPEAAFAAAVTGHLGPDAPPDLDGTVFVAVANRVDGKPVVDRWLRTRLHTLDRVSRQAEAAAILLGLLNQVIASGGGSS